MARQREEDEKQIRSESRESEAKKIATLKKKAQKITSWTSENEDRIGPRGKPVKSNTTDNESAKLVSSHGVIQGYNGIATVVADHQIVVDAQAFGDVHEAAHVQEIIESVETTFSFLDPDQKPFDSLVLTADEFTFNDEGVLICPAGKPMKSSCPVRERCLRSPRSPVWQVTKTDQGMRHNTKSAIHRMMERFDSERCR